MTEIAETVDPTVQPFAAFLQDLRGGRAHAELTDAFAELIALVAERNKAGTLTFKLTVKPDAGVQVTVIDEVSVKAPKSTRPVSLFFITDEHGLSREDPRQPKLPLREVPPRDTRDLKEAT